MHRYLLLFLLLLAPSTVWGAEASSCVPPGRWQDPANGVTLDPPRLLADMARRPVVLLGETHTNAEHHRWQLHTVAALFALNPNMVLGFEAFPRAAQPVLDRWSRGDLTERDFLRLSRWNEVWRYDSGFYMPLFHFARMNRIPMRALNVDRDLVRRASRDGWSSVPEGERDGVGDPAPPSQAYRASLRKVFSQHGDDREDTPLSEAGEKMLAGFIEGQTVWDRAMAEAVADARTAGGEPLVVAIVGRGHLEYGYGISHQLADLGIENAAVLLPWEQALPCDELKSPDGVPVAHAVFGLAEPEEKDKPPHPMLGVQIETAADNGGVKVVKVLDGSVAKTAGLQDGDLIVEAAGLPMTRTGDLVATIHRHNPGTWLPLVIVRDGERRQVVAKFPPRP